MAVVFGRCWFTEDSVFGFDVRPVLDFYRMWEDLYESVISLFMRHGIDMFIV